MFDLLVFIPCQHLTFGKAIVESVVVVFGPKDHLNKTFFPGFNSAATVFSATGFSSTGIEATVSWLPTLGASEAAVCGPTLVEVSGL